MCAGHFGNRTSAGISVVNATHQHGRPAPGKPERLPVMHELRPDPLTFQASGTVTRELAQTVEFADESVDCGVARFLN
jgi:hypothetical protein